MQNKLTKSKVAHFVSYSVDKNVYLFLLQSVRADQKTRHKGPFTNTYKGGPDAKRGPLKFLTLVRGP